MAKKTTAPAAPAAPAPVAPAPVAQTQFTDPTSVPRAAHGETFAQVKAAIEAESVTDTDKASVGKVVAWIKKHHHRELTANNVYQTMLRALGKTGAKAGKKEPAKPTEEALTYCREHVGDGVRLLGYFKEMEDHALAVGGFGMLYKALVVTERDNLLREGYEERKDDFAGCLEWLSEQGLSMQEAISFIKSQG